MSVKEKTEKLKKRMTDTKNGKFVKKTGVNLEHETENTETPESNFGTYLAMAFGLLGLILWKKK